MQNIRLEYLYRDYANYKNHGYVIFSNHHGISLAEIEHHLRAKMLDGVWFCATHYRLPDLHFPHWDCETDHPYHELAHVAHSAHPPTCSRDISELLALR